MEEEGAGKETGGGKEGWLGEGKEDWLGEGKEDWPAGEWKEEEKFCLAGDSRYIISPLLLLYILSLMVSLRWCTCKTCH